MRRITKDNKGFSLVELMVAVVILGIVVAPLLHTFVTSASTATKARKIGDATLAAQNLAERVEAASLANLVASPSTALAAVGAEHYSPNGDGSYSPVATTPPYRNQEYYMGIQHLVSGNSTFNALITMKAVSGQLNGALITRYSPMDAVFSQSYPGEQDDPDTMAKAEFATVTAANNATADTPTRTITMDITATQIDIVDGKKVYNIGCKLTYSYNFPYTYEQDITDPITGDVVGTESVSSTFPKSIEYDLLPSGLKMTEGDPPSIYLLYNPWYVESSTDKIIINNLNDIPMPLFLVKQDVLNPASAIGIEMHYLSEISLKQSANCYPADGAIVYSNAKKSFSGVDLAAVTYKVYRSAHVYYSGITFPNEGSLVVREEENRLYNVTVSLYDVGDTTFSGTPIYTFHSSKLQ